MRHATQLKSPKKSHAKTPPAESFVLTVIGGVIRKTLSVHKPPTPRKRAVPVETHLDHCELCEAAIERFDRETFAETGRCQPCDRDLAGGN